MEKFEIMYKIKDKIRKFVTFNGQYVLQGEEVAQRLNNYLIENREKLVQRIRVSNDCEMVFE